MEQGREERGQMNFDLLVGVSIFLITLGFVFAMVSGLVDPFVGNQEHTLIADRIATLLGDGALAADRPSVLNASCAYGFFNASYLAHNGTECRVGFQANKSDLHDRLEIHHRYSVNISFYRFENGNGGKAILCTDGSELIDCPGETKLAAGPVAPSSRGSSVSARRVLVLDGVDVVLEVQLW